MAIFSSQNKRTIVSLEGWLSFEWVFKSWLLNLALLQKLSGHRSINLVSPLRFQAAPEHVAEHSAAPRPRFVRPPRGPQRLADHLRHQLDQALVLQVRTCF